MLSIIKNTIKLLMNKKSFIAMGIVAPAIIIVFFSFVFGKDPTYKVGIIDNDSSYMSKEIIKTVENIDNIEVNYISETDYKILLASHQVQLVVIINEGFNESIINLVGDEVIIKSISNSDVKTTLVSIIKSKTEDLSMVAKASNKDFDKFKETNEKYKDNLPTMSINKSKDTRPSIENSIGIVIMMVFITGATIANFTIEDEENNTKSRILASGINPAKYYMALMIVFYILSSMSSIIYYIMCKLLNLNFNMINTNNFLIVMLMINLVSVSLNLCIVSFTRSRYIASTLNILIVIPSCMLSGIFWDFDVMPKYLQRIGEFLPQRWVYVCMESLQNHNNLSYIYGYILAMSGISFIFFIVSIVIFKYKRIN